MDITRFRKTTRVAGVALLIASAGWGALTITTFIVQPYFESWKTNASFVVFFGTFVVFGAATGVAVVRQTVRASAGAAALSMAAVGTLFPLYLAATSHGIGQVVLVGLAIPCAVATVALVRARASFAAIALRDDSHARTTRGAVGLALFAGGFVFLAILAPQGWVMLAPLGLMGLVGGVALVVSAIARTREVTGDHA